MKRKMIIYLLIVGIMVSGAFAASITRTNSDTGITTYSYTYTGNGSWMRSSCRTDASNGKVCESYIKNTANYTEAITVSVKEVNDYITGYTKKSSNNGNITSGSGIGCAPITRATGHSNFHYIHIGEVLNYQTRNTVDVYSVTINQ